jgi:transglutaminase-like putative cysteine protease
MTQPFLIPRTVELAPQVLPGGGAFTPPPGTGFSPIPAGTKRVAYWTHYTAASVTGALGYAIEYSTIRNIGDYCRSRGYGDCGQEALLFMTLCRLNGIPARWQSGWNTFPTGKDIHDWCEIYVAPWGWMPVDPWAGINAMQYAATLTPEQRRAMRDFYFCRRHDRLGS